MSDAPLPADMAAWPRGHHQLLGVGHAYGPRELKQAYTRLIRFYKPELYPQEFARLREAYDSLLPWAAAPSESRQEDLPAPAEVAPLLPPPALISDDAEDWWDKAVTGDAAAYRGLQEEVTRRPSAERNYVRLFWLAAAFRDIDPARHPADWLARGLSACPGSARLAETYGTYLSMEPLEAGTPRCAAVVAGLDEPRQAAVVIRHVWLSLLRRRQWQEVRAQMPAVNAKLGLATGAWVGLLILAADHAGWEGGLGATALMQDCLRELDQLGLAAAGQGDLFDRIDFQKTLTKAAAATGGDGAVGLLAGIVRRAWLADADAVRGDLHAFVADVAARPNRWANRLDAGGTAAAVLAFQCCQLITQLWGEGAYLFPPGRADKAAARARAELEPRPYPNFRDAICRFCLATFTPPEVLAAPLAPKYARKFPQDSPLEELILGDWPLRLVCLAHRFYHS